MKYVQLCGPYILITTTQLCCYSAEAAKQYKHGVTMFNEIYLQNKRGGSYWVEVVLHFAVP